MQDTALFCRFRPVVLLPTLRVVLPHTRARLEASWAALLNPGDSAATPSGGTPRSAAGANDEVGSDN